MPRSRGRKHGTGSQSGALGKKAPRLWVQWGPVKITRADGTTEVRPPLKLKPKRRRK